MCSSNVACTSASTAAAGWQNCFNVVVFRSTMAAVVIIVLSGRHCTSIVNGQTELKLMMDKQQQMSTMIPDEDG